MGEGPRGICLVINNCNFLGEDERQGANLDEEAIACLFNDLHFIVEIRQNLGGLEILKVAQEMAGRDHSNYEAFVFCIMSHGDKKDVIYGVDNRKAGMEDLMSEFTATNCPTLENKPNMFFIQACRGQRSDLRMNRLSASTADNIAEDSIQIMHILPMLTSQTVFLLEKLTSFWHSLLYQGTKPGEANKLAPGLLKYVLKCNCLGGIFDEQDRGKWL